MIEIAAVITLLLVVVGLILLANDHRRRHPQPARKHRARERREDAYRHPLTARERQFHAPTYYADKALPASPGEDTALIAPRPNREVTR